MAAAGDLVIEKIRYPPRADGCQHGEKTPATPERVKQSQDGGGADAAAGAGPDDNRVRVATGRLAGDTGGLTLVRSEDQAPRPVSAC